MKTIIAGSREIDLPSILLKALKGVDWKITEVVSGGARGVDKMGEVWADENEIPMKQFLPKWRVNGHYDPTAGFKRNAEMAEYGEALLSIWDGESKGTKDMIENATKKKLKIVVYNATTGKFINEKRNGFF